MDFRRSRAHRHHLASPAWCADDARVGERDQRAPHQPGVHRTGGRRTAGDEKPPDQLLLELTETTIAEQKDSSAAALARISETGVRLTLDSFGIGASTLAQVMRLPVSSKMTNRSAVTEL